MSLIAWYPLNKDLKNYGISDSSDMARQEGIMSIKKNGKLGKYVNFNCSVSGGTEKNNITTSLLTSDNMRNLSISFWLYVGTGSHNRFADIINFETPNSTNVRMTLEFDSISSGSFVLRWFGGRAKDASGYCPTNNLLYNTWYHITTVYDETDVKLYINGNLVSTYIFDSSNITKLSGNWHLGDATTLCENIGFNDVRIYDHSLSKTEIKEIAKGLVVHYPLNSGYGNENLLVNSYNGCNVSYTSSTILDETYYGFKIRYLKYEGTSYQDTIQVLNVVTPKPDSYYTASFWAKGNCGIHNFFFPNNCASGISSDGYTTTSADGNCYISLTPEWKRYWITWKTKSDVSGAKNICIGRIQNKGTGAECYIAGLKFEEGDKNSVWSPNEADDLYSILGYDSTTIYDTSGLENNGIINNTKIYSTDTPLYDSSINLQRTNSNYIDLQGVYLTTQSTINLWGKVSTAGNYQRLFEFTNGLANHNNQIALYSYQNTLNVGFAVYGGENGITELFKNDNIQSQATSWHMYSVVFDKTSLKVYIDGENVIDTTMSKEINNIVRQYAYIGKSTFSNDAYLDGGISDFRIYSTALSAGDIKQLYESKARVDKNGNVYCGNFIEVGMDIFKGNYEDSTVLRYINAASCTYDDSDYFDTGEQVYTCTTSTAGQTGIYWRHNTINFYEENIAGAYYLLEVDVKCSKSGNFIASKESSSVLMGKAEFIAVADEWYHQNLLVKQSTASGAIIFYYRGNIQAGEQITISVKNMKLIKITENEVSKIMKNCSIIANNFTEYTNEDNAKIYKYDIQANEIIEI